MGVKKTTVFILSLLCFVSAWSQTIPPNVPQSGLVAWYPFNGNANDESVNNNHGVVTNASLTTDRFGNPASAYYFDGQNDYIEVPWPNEFHFNSNESFTLNVWIRPDSIDPSLSFGKSQRVFWKYSCPYNTTLDVVGIQFTDGPNLKNRSSSHNVNVYHPLTDLCKDWFMVTYVKDAVNDSIFLYIDGIRVNSGPVPNHAHSTQIPFQFGMHRWCTSGSNNLTPTHIFKGKIDDGGIWDRKLTQAEITGLYDYSFSRDIELSSNVSDICPGDSFWVTYTSPAQDTNSYWDVSTPTDSFVVSADTVFIDSADTGMYVFELYIDSMLCKDTSFVIDTIGCTQCLVGDYRFSGNTLDSSGLNHHGTSMGATPATNRFGDPNTAYSFDGNSDYIEVNNNQPVITKDEFTIIAAVQKRGAAGGVFSSQALFSQRSDVTTTSGNNSIVNLSAENVSGDYRLAVRKSGSSSIDAVTYPAPQDTNWHCYGAVLDTTNTLRLYIDAVEVASATTAQTGDFVSSIDYNQIGRFSYNGVQNQSLFNGKMEFMEVHDCFVDPVETCKEWMCNGFNAQVSVDSVSFAECASAVAVVDSISYGHPPFSYSWSNGDSVQQTLLDTGAHYVMISDSLGCTYADSFYVAPHDTLSLISDSTRCFNDSFYIQSSDTNNIWDKNWTITTPDSTYSVQGDSLNIHLGSSGTYEFELAYFDSLCADTLVHTLQIDSPAVAAQIVKQNNFFPGCAGSEVYLDTLIGKSPFQIDWSNGGSNQTTFYDTGQHHVLVTDSNGCTWSDTFNIAPDSLTFSVDTSLSCSGDTLFFASSDTGGGFQKSWLVTAPDSNFTVVGDSFTYKVSDSGLYEFTFVYEKNSCSDTLIYTHESLTQPLMTYFSTTKNYFPGCAGALASIDSITGGTSPYTAVWSAGDTALQTELDTGFHSVLVIDSFGCERVDSFRVEPDSIEVIIPNSDSLCASDSFAVFSSDSVVGFQKNWTITHPDTTYTSTRDTVPVAPVTAGTYLIELTYDSAGCSHSVFDSLTVDTFPELTITSTDSVFCEFDSIFVDTLPGFSYSWSNGSQEYYTLVQDTGDLTVTGTSPEGCVYHDTLRIDSVIRFSLNLPDDTILCAGDTAELMIPADFDSVLWNDGDTSFTKFVDSAGVYSVNVFNVCGQLNDTIEVEAVPLLESFTLSDTQICMPDNYTVEIPDEHADSVIWDDGFFGSVRTVGESGDYRATAVNRCGTYSDSFELVVADTPQVMLDEAYELCEQEEVFKIKLDLDPQYEYVWNTGSTEPSIVLEDSGYYAVTVTNEEECASNYDFVVELCPFEVVVPNVFTPNGDGVNDVFLIKGLRGKEFSFQIYNRWGNLLFDNQGFIDSWDGTSNGEAVPSGTYFYILEFTNEVNNQQETRKGTLQLLRE